MKCEICNRDFSNYTTLGSHIGQSHKEFGVKGYYDKFMKMNPEEGICKNPNCKKETKFIYLTIGYNDCCSRKCSTSMKDFKKIKSNRTKQICKFCGKEFISKTALSSHINHPNSIHKDEVEKIKIEKEKDKKIICELCGNKYKILQDLGKHLGLFHGGKTAKKDYYDNYLKKDTSEGICKTCGNPTSFVSLNYGYYTYCNTRCSKLDPEVEQKSQQTCLKNYGVTNFAKTDSWLSQMSEGGQAAYMLTFIQNPSKPQIEILNLVKEIYPDATINIPCLNYCLDIAIPSIKIAIEYNGEYWHRGKEEYDLQRQKNIQDQGWKVLIYKGELGKDIIPSKEKLQKDIQGLLCF